MAMATADLRRRDELLSRLKTLWGDMSSEERSAVEVVINSMILNHATANAEKVSFPPLSEAEMIGRIDLSLAQADRGEYEEADVFEREIEAEFGLV